MAAHSLMGAETHRHQGFSNSVSAKLSVCWTDDADACSLQSDVAPDCSVWVALLRVMGSGERSLQATAARCEREHPLRLESEQRQPVVTFER